VWRKDGENAMQEIPIVVPAGSSVNVECIYPEGLPVQYEYNEEKQVICVTLEEKFRARVLKVNFTTSKCE